MIYRRSKIFQNLQKFNHMYECRIRDEKYPRVGEVVLTKTASINDSIISMCLVEYGEIPGLVLSNEVSKKKIRSIHQITKVGNTEVCQVLKVDEARGHIDLSMKSVGEAERRECLAQANRNKFAYQIMHKVSKLIDRPVSELYDEFGYEKSRVYGSLHTYFAKAQNDLSMWDGNQYREQFISVIEKQIKPESYKVRIDVDVTNPHRGVEGVVAGFMEAIKVHPELEVTVLKTPTYSMTCVCEEKDQGFAIVNDAAEIVRSFAIENGGTFAISVAAKVYGEKLRHKLLEKDVDGTEVANSDTSCDSDDSDS